MSTEINPELFDILFGESLKEDSDEWKKIQRHVDLHNLETHELESLMNEIECILQQRRKENSDESRLL